GDGTLTDSGNPAAACTNVDSRALKPLAQKMNITGQILQQVNINIKTDDESQVLVRNDLAQKITAYNFFFRQHVLHAAAGIDQDSQRQRLICLSGEVFDGLRLSVFRDFKLILGQPRNQ